MTGCPYADLFQSNGDASGEVSLDIYQGGGNGLAIFLQQFPLLAVKFSTTLSAAHSNSPLPVYDRLSRRLFQMEQLTTLLIAATHRAQGAPSLSRQDVVSLD
jgi:hypothetical protein